MATQNERQVKEFAELENAEMMRIQGGAWYAKFDGVDGSSASSASGDGSGKLDLAALDIQRGR
jgi:hypothetical protein